MKAAYAAPQKKKKKEISKHGSIKTHDLFYKQTIFSFL